ncbi:PREDICTED: lys-63-specific deubiquitinase BRCC36-like [Priapulus caudatus]|uniref:Lys-63-specific deubiquitinase BRCC36-like n=1 Tax=Priapulus caudatus TaxID=37621 RepID=A0ABM1DRA3_PRICU|nr:PREDICTED: lys-63-specific deubiquitinase BRCC36-like [Priapulus caudatus]
MTVSCVKLSSDAFMVCLTHALSTENEEVMGLCIGEVDENRVSHISAVMLLRRSDKRKDRVEISPEQLSNAAIHAEILTAELKRPMRVLGWYHSHPHITVWPSHVDVRTQAMYQLMDECFVGLIFSTFNEDKKSKQQRIQVTCFQSTNHSPEGEPPMYERIEVPLQVAPSSHISRESMQSLVTLPGILTEEESEAYTSTFASKDLDLVTRLHNSAVFTKSICHMMEVLTGPLMQSLENRCEHDKRLAAQLLTRKQELERQLEELS